MKDGTGSLLKLVVKVRREGEKSTKEKGLNEGMRSQRR